MKTWKMFACELTMAMLFAALAILALR